MKQIVREVVEIKIDNEVGKISTIVTSLFILLIALNFTFNISPGSGLSLDKTAPLEYILTVMGFFLIDMILAYHFVSQ